MLVRNDQTEGAHNVPNREERLSKVRSVRHRRRLPQARDAKQGGAVAQTFVRKRFSPSQAREAVLAMTVGTSIFLLAAGAILRYAVDDAIEGVDMATVGLILMIAGAVGLVIGLWMMRRPPVAEDRVVERRVDPRDPRY